MSSPDENQPEEEKIAAQKEDELDVVDPSAVDNTAAKAQTKAKKGLLLLAFIPPISKTFSAVGTLTAQAFSHMSGFFTNTLEMLVAFYFFLKEKNKNLSKTTELLIIVLAALIVLFVLFAHVIVVGPAALGLLLAAASMKFLYSTVVVVSNLIRWAVLAATTKEKDAVYEERVAIFKAAIQRHGISMLFSAVAIIGIVTVTILHILFPPTIVISVLAAVFALAFTSSAYTTYKKMKEGKLTSIKDSAHPFDLTESATLSKAPTQQETKVSSPHASTATLMELHPELMPATPVAEPVMPKRNASVQKPPQSLLSKLSSNILDKDLEEHGLAIREMMALTSQSDAKALLDSKISDKLARLRQERVEDIGSVSGWWQENKREHKIAVLEKLNTIISTVDANPSAAEIQNARKEFETLMKGDEFKNGFQSFWRTKGEVETLVQSTKLFLSRLTPTPSPSESSTSLSEAVSRSFSQNEHAGDTISHRSEEPHIRLE